MLYIQKQEDQMKDNIIPPGGGQWEFGGLDPTARAQAGMQRLVAMAKHMTQFMIAAHTRDSKAQRDAAAGYLRELVGLSHTMLLPEIMSAHLLHRLGPEPSELTREAWNALSDEQKIAADHAMTERVLKDCQVELHDLIVPALRSGTAAVRPFEALQADIIRMLDDSEPTTFRPRTVHDRRRRDPIELAERHHAVLLSYCLAAKRGVSVKDLIESKDLRYAPSYHAFEEWAATVPMAERNRMICAGECEGRSEGLPPDVHRELGNAETYVLGRGKLPEFEGLDDAAILDLFFARVRRVGDFSLLRSAGTKDKAG
jgi:hypothetical protein